MNNLLVILGVLALSNGNLNLFENKENKSKNKSRSIKKKTKNKPRDIVSADDEDENNYFFNINDAKKSINLLDLSEEDLERGMEIIVRTKKYMNRDEKVFLTKIESVLDLIRGMKKLNGIGGFSDLDESDFFRNMEEEDKKNMMIKEIIEVFPETRKGSFEKAMDMKKKIELFAELLLPDDIGEKGFSLGSLASLGNLGSISNLKLLGSLLRGDDDKQEDDNYDEYEHEEDDEYINDEEFVETDKK